ncbi:MAG TPA: alpha-amylase family glycosyl hydrolase, partial [Balneolaceae bacterium]|nr:alpha-amylase family glycosyl hydrolase [Balneolaceae bacterium]
MNFETKIQNHLEFLYGSESAADLSARVQKLVEKYGFELPEIPLESRKWSQKDAILITYGDVILPQNGSLDKLQTLANFLTNYLGDSISAVHILPFFTSSSDRGFSVIDYKDVRDDLGNWQDIEDLTQQYRVMVDLVINHTSRYSKWFENYQKGEEPGKDYFIEMDPTTDLSMAVRPRSSPLLTSVKTQDGLRYVWTTFSDDQIDLDFTNPDVLMEFIDIFLFYLSKGVKLVRLDAIAYLWKKIGTKSIHLNETHQVVKLFRTLMDFIDPEAKLITETNVPFEENISYFGDGDETHMVYQFSLPPLLLHAILTENAHYLSKWASHLPDPPEGCTYFNFTASHDGIGVRPIEGLVPNKDFEFLVQSTEERGGFVSYKTNSDGSQSPYELNITYYDAFADSEVENSDLQVKRFLCSQIITLSLQGVPGIYFHNLTAT